MSDQRQVGRQLASVTLCPETTLITKVACGFGWSAAYRLSSPGEHPDGTLPSARYTVTVGCRGGHDGTGRLVQNRDPSRLGAGCSTTAGSGEAVSLAALPYSVLSSGPGNPSAAPASVIATAAFCKRPAWRNATPGAVTLSTETTSMARRGSRISL
jgi:hypothetical protein